MGGLIFFLYLTTSHRLSIYFSPKRLDFIISGQLREQQGTKALFLSSRNLSNDIIFIIHRLSSFLSSSFDKIKQNLGNIDSTQ